LYPRLRRIARYSCMACRRVFIAHLPAMEARVFAARQVLTAVKIRA
jgi:hypothetical protein